MYNISGCPQFPFLAYGEAYLMRYVDTLVYKTANF